jgi:hypothetical protein
VCEDAEGGAQDMKSVRMIEEAPDNVEVTDYHCVIKSGHELLAEWNRRGFQEIDVNAL